MRHRFLESINCVLTSYFLTPRSFTNYRNFQAKKTITTANAGQKLNPVPEEISQNVTVIQLNGHKIT